MRNLFFPFVDLKHGKKPIWQPHKSKTAQVGSPYRGHEKNKPNYGLETFNLNRQTLIRVYHRYSRTPLLRPPSKSDWSGRKRGVVVHEGLDYFITCALWYTHI